MATEDYLFIQPWFHPDETWGGFQLGGSNPTLAGGEVSHLFSLAATRSVNSGLPWFVPVVNESDVRRTQALPPERLVFLLKPPADPAHQEAAEQFEADLRRSGRKLGLIVSPGDPLPPTGAWDYVVMAVGHARTLPPFTLMGLASRTLVAVNSVRSRNDYAWAAANQCSLVSGEYLLTRQTALGKPDVTRLKLLELLALVAQDADTPALEEVFKQQPKLSYGLLRLVNSGAIAPRSPITSFGQAINLLGRRQLQRWLQLLVYAVANHGAPPNPLLLMAATRGRLMELLAARRPPVDGIDDWGDAAFMVGTFSLLDVLLNLSMADILPQLPLPEAVQEALATHGGPFGDLLKIIAAVDNHDLPSAASLLAQSGLAADGYTEDQINALEWASKIRTPS